MLVALVKRAVRENARGPIRSSASCLRPSACYQKRGGGGDRGPRGVEWSGPPTHACCHGGGGKVNREWGGVVVETDVEMKEDISRNDWNFSLAV